MKPQPSTHVIFGTGQLGLAVMDELTARGVGVTLVNRSGRVGEPLPAGARVVRADVTDPTQVAAVTAGAAVAFHTAQPLYHEWPTGFPPITQGILEGVARSGARLVFGDNLYMYGPTGGKPIHEGLPYAATGHKGSTRAAMAQTLLDAHRAGRVRVAIGRASDFYGPRVMRSALGDRFWEAALAGKRVDMAGNVDLPHTYTFVPDFARALVTLSERDEALGRAWHVPSAPTLTTRELIALVEDELGHPIPIRAAGRLMIGLIGLFNRDLREIRELMYEFEEPYTVDHSQFARAFGDHHTPHRDAIRQTVAWWRAQGVAQPVAAHA